MQEGIIINNNYINAPIYTILLTLKSELSNGKLAQIYDKGDYCMVTCPNDDHSGGREQHASCTVNYSRPEVDYGFFHCFTCGAGGPLWKFVAECLDISEELAKQWLVDNFSEGIVNSVDLLEAIPLESESSEIEEPIYLDESILDTFESYHPYMTQRHISNEIISQFKIKYDRATKSIVFPVYDLHNKLRYLTRRSVEGKTFDLGKGLNKSIIYLLNEVINRNYTYCIVAESQINALTAWSWGYPAVALFGAGTTTGQLNTLNNTDISLFILAYDPDQAGNKGAAKFIKGIGQDKMVVNLILPQGKDLNDLTKAEFDELLRKNDLEFLIH